MDNATKQRLFDFLCTYVSDARKEKFIEVAANRTRHLTVVLEDIFQPQNASAVVRTADCMGVQDIYVAEGRNKYRINPQVVMGSSKWLNVHKYQGAPNNIENCYADLKAKGYRIVATSPHARGYTLHDLPVDQKLALVFGTELKGLSKYAMDNADDYVMIPLYGFTESFNISVTAALFIHHIIDAIRSKGLPWQLSEDERLDLLVDWARKAVNRPELLEKHFNNVLLHS